MREDWSIRKLGEVSDIAYGYTEKAAAEPVGPKFLRITDIQNDSVNWDAVPYCKIDDEEHERYRLLAGDIVFARTGATTGKSYMVSNPPDAVCASYLIRLRLRSSDLLPRFVSYYLSTKAYWDAVSTGISGSAQGGFNASKLGALQIPVSSLPEQQRIVAILDETFAGLATATANAEKNLKNARELVDSYLRSIFAQNWEAQLLGDICENLDSRRIPVTKRDRKLGETPYYGASGAVDYVADFIFDEDLLLVSEDGANLLMRTYPIAFSIRGKSWVNNHAHVLRFPDLASQKFVEHYLNSISLAPFVNGMAQPKLNQKALNSIPVPWPKLDERSKAVAHLDELAAQTEDLRERYETKIAGLTELKQSILQKAFSGELTSPPSQAIREAAE